MMPIYENIDVAINTSMKVATYSHSEACETDSWHIHPEYELVYIRNGNGILRINSLSIPYEDGVLLLLGPNIPHAGFGNSEFSNNLEVVIQFRKEFLDEKLAAFPEFKGLKSLIEMSSQVLLFNNDLKDKIAKYFEQLESMSVTQKLINFIIILEEMASSNLYRTILSKKTLIKHKAADVNRLESIFEYVNEHYNENISIKTLSTQLGLTTNSFCRFFKKMTSQTFVQFVNEFRIRKATELLNKTQPSISEVMYLCGFNDLSYFTKQFKKYHGITPTSYLLLNT